MTLLDVINLDKIWTINSVRKKNFWAMSELAQLWFEIYEKFKIKTK